MLRKMICFEAMREFIDPSAKTILGYTKQTKNKILDNLARVMLAWLIRCSTT